MRKYSLSLFLFAGSPFLWAQAEKPIVAGDLSHEARSIPFNKRIIPDIETQIRTEVAIVLPESEKVMSVTCGDAGDAGSWVLVWSPESNVVVVKPTKQGMRTNLNVQADHGNVYTFALHEVSLIQGAHADLKVYIEPDAALREALKQPPKFVDARVAEEYKHAAELARADADASKVQAQQRLEQSTAAVSAKAPLQLKFDYQFDHSKKAPFHLDSIGHDDRFTYIYGKFSEPPAIFEIKDKQPALVAYDYEDGVYVIRKVVEQGQLRVGKKLMAFSKRVDGDL
jgi:type IV secretory pathway VirB9-like protein